MTTPSHKWKSKYNKHLRKLLKKEIKKHDNEKYRRRLKAIQLLEKYPIKEVGDISDRSVRTIFRWKAVAKKGGTSALHEKSRCPHTIHRISNETVEQVISHRMEYHEGCEKTALNVGISASTVHRILTKAGLITQKRKKTRWRSYQRKHSNSLWQMDFSQLYEDLWVLIIIDDHSRYIIGYKLMKTPNVDDALDCLNECINIYGVPKQILTDHGSQFYAVRGGVSTFDIFCMNTYIKHILARVRHPQTNGKVERKIGVIKEHLEWKGLLDKRSSNETIEKELDEYTEYHNFSRYHFTYERHSFGDVEVKKKVAFIPYLRFVCHRC